MGLNSAMPQIFCSYHDLFYIRPLDLNVTFNDMKKDRHLVQPDMNMGWVFPRVGFTHGLGLFGSTIFYFHGMVRVGSKSNEPQEKFPVGKVIIIVERPVGKTPNRNVNLHL